MGSPLRYPPSCILSEAYKIAALRAPLAHVPAEDRFDVYLPEIVRPTHNGSAKKMSAAPLLRELVYTIPLVIPL